MRATGRLPFVADPRDDSYTPQRLAAMVELGLARDVAWSNASPVLDQDGEPECVAFGILGLLNTDDEQHNNPGFGNADARAFFKTIAGAGADGAMVRDGLMAAKAQRLIEAFALLRTDEDIDEWLANHGPVVVGTLWTEQMMRPVGGLVLVRTTTTRDGHCWYLYGQDVYYRLATNSWGTAWGEGGLFKMRRCDFTKLMHAGGEAWAVVQGIPAPSPAPLSLWKRLTKWLKGTA